jgi:hypothetical protein
LSIGHGWVRREKALSSDYLVGRCGEIDYETTADLSPPIRSSVKPDFAAYSEASKAVREILLEVSVDTIIGLSSAVAAS